MKTIQLTADKIAAARATLYKLFFDMYFSFTYHLIEINDVPFDTYTISHHLFMRILLFLRMHGIFLMNKPSDYNLTSSRKNDHKYCRPTNYGLMWRAAAT